MSHGEPKKNLETVQGYKAKGASVSEASAAASNLSKVVASSESEQDLRAAAVALQRELEAPPTGVDTARREELMRAAAALGARNV